MATNPPLVHAGFWSLSSSLAPFSPSASLTCLTGTASGGESVGRRWFEKLYVTISSSYGNLCSLSHTCALSLHLMALSTGFLAPPLPPAPPPTSPSIQRQTLSSPLPLRTSKLCPFLTNAATSTHTDTLITFAQNIHSIRPFVLMNVANQCFPPKIFFISRERCDILALDVGWSSSPA